MSLAISADHASLAEVVADFVTRHDVLAASRRLLEGAPDGRPPFWDELARLGWLGLHVDEEHGGSGYGLPELCIVVEELGKAVAPGPFVPTVIASALLSAVGGAADRIGGLADGSTTAGVGLGGSVTLAGGTASGDAGTVVGGATADLLIVPAGGDVVVVERGAAGVHVAERPNLDPMRRSAHVTLDGATVTVLPGARQRLLDLARLVFAAEATGIARAATEQAAGYAKVREQFGRVIATFQAVKHHCANMFVNAESATALVWDAARGAAAGGEAFSYAAAMAASVALPAAYDNANLNTQVHGGIAMTWEHDAHLFLRRAIVLGAIVDAEAAARQVVDLARAGVRLGKAVALPPEAEQYREQARRALAEVKDLEDRERQKALVKAGYAVPHWPAPWGRDAKAVEQLVIEEEYAAAGIKKPSYGITSWVILTILQHGTQEQVARVVQPALDGEVIWCQLFSEPAAGSDAAGVRARATRVEGGWRVNGQKVWTSGAHVASYGLATVRTDPDVAKHAGITTMIIDMHADGVEVRPLKMPNGGADFNEVFLTDVFVPDADVVGDVNQGWTVARATLGNESVSIGGGTVPVFPGEMFLPDADAHPDRLPGGPARLGRYLARTRSVDAMNLRSAERAVAASGPGPEGAVTKLLLSENGHDAAAIAMALAGPEAAFSDGGGALSSGFGLMHRAISIAGGTSEIKRNQIAERLLGLPRDPLIR